MSNPAYVLPDVVLASLQYLRGRADVTALLDAAHIETALPSNPTYPYVLLTYAGGQGIWPALSDDAIQFECVDLQANKASLSLLARTVRSAIWGIRNDIVAAGCLVSSREEQGPQWSPDPTTKPPLASYIQRHRILNHP